MYVLIQDGKVIEFPYSIAGFKQKHKEVSFPVKITDGIYEQFGIFRVFGMESIPAYNKTTHRIALSPLECVAGKWFCHYQVVELTDDELRRNQELSDKKRDHYLQMRLKRIQEARRAWLDDQIDPDGIALALLLYTKGNQKGIDMQVWVTTLAEESDKRQAELEAGIRDWDEGLLDFSMFPKPHSIRKLRAEL